MTKKFNRNENHIKVGGIVMEKMIKKIVAASLIIMILSTYFIIIGQVVSIALSEEDTNADNVKYDAYFNVEESKVHEKDANLEEEQTLIINVSVKNQGILKNAKINIENANFTIIKEKVENEYVKKVDTDKNEIELKSIIYSNNAIIEIPVKFKNQNNFAEDYFEREININLTGTYNNEDNIEIEAQRKVKLNWTADTEVNFTQEIAKYINLSENEILLQQNIYTEVPNNILPRKQEIINIKAQQINEKYPQEVIVVVNGTKLDAEKVKYNSEDGNIEIINSKTQNEENETIWGNAKNEYNVIYTYNEIETQNETINLETTIATQLYSKDETITKSENITAQVEEKGNIVEVAKQATNNLYKGYMYANSENETIFEEINTIEISKAEKVENIELTNQEETFVDERDRKYKAATIYKATTLNKKGLEKIFGENYEIKILDKENNELAKITNTTESDEAGNVTINYNGEIDYIRIVTNKPQVEGKFAIRNMKAIKGNTNYTKDQLKNFNKLNVSSIVTNGDRQATGSTQIELNDTRTEAKLEMSNTNLSTQANTDVQFSITLKSEDAQYDLYKNPKLKVILPQEFDINVKTTEQLNFEDEIRITKIGLQDREDGKKELIFESEGEQTNFASKIVEGIQIAVISDITIASTTPSKDETIELIYTNENRPTEQFTYEVPIRINSIQEEMMANQIEYYPNIEETSNEEIGNVELEANEEPIATFSQEADGISVNIVAKSGDETLQENDVVQEGQAIKYVISLTNNTEEDIKDMVLEATNTNAIYYGEVEIEVEVAEEMEKKQEYKEDTTLTSKQIKIEELKAGETKEVSYQIAVKEVEDNEQTVTGEIKITAEGIEQTIPNITNRINKGDLKLILADTTSLDLQLSETNAYPLEFKVENISQETLKDVIVEIPVSEKLSFSTENINAENAQFLENKDGVIKFKIDEIEEGQTETIYIRFYVKEIPQGELGIMVSQYFNVNYNNIKYTSNYQERYAKKYIVKIEGTQKTNINGNIVKNGDNVIITIEIENQEALDASIDISDAIPKALKVNSIKTIQNGIETIEENNRIFIKTIYDIKPREKIQIIIDTTVDVDTTLDIGLVEGNKIINIVNITGVGIVANINTLELIVEGKEPLQTIEKIERDISGIVWLDENKNGNRDSEEELLQNITVALLEAKTQNIVKDKNGDDMITTTNERGVYAFKEVPKGRYIVAFMYDSKKYGITEYQKEGVSTGTNSDVISAKIKSGNISIEVAKTKELDLDTTNLVNIDAGFTKLEKFDLKLEKYVDKITVNNVDGTRTVTYNKGKLAKVEIDAKKIANSKVTIEYSIEVTNEGEVQGYANEIIDYLPSDLKFNSKTSPEWEQREDGNLYTTQLAKQVILPGETKTVKVILTKDMTQDNTGRILNRAEINKHYNESGLNDIDSTPGNREEKEDDMSSADVIISIKTGSAIIYTTTIIASISMLAIGIYLIKKKVLN